MQSLQLRVKICVFVFSFLLALSSGNNSIHASNTNENLILNSYDEYAAVIISYQRIGEDSFPENNIRKEQFEEHIEELASGSYNVISLDTLINALMSNTRIPEKTVVITFDGGYKSVSDIAAPLLLKHSIPFTVFVATDHLNVKSKKYMNWNDLKKLMKSNLVTIGLHPASYTHLDLNDNEEIKRLINRAKTTFRDKFNFNPEYFSYSFGEHSTNYKNIIKKSGFKAAVGQQSGVTYLKSDLYAIPRFNLTESYSDIERFRLVINALPLPIENIEPSNPLLETSTPLIGFTVNENILINISKLSCFISGQTKPDIKVIGSNRVEIRAKSPFHDKRTRINCTMPGPSNDLEEKLTWRWLGMLYFLPPELTHNFDAYHN
jgi:peptidoglycan/xylan/chitin deacetylase (PgdA/CDA1 family)